MWAIKIDITQVESNKILNPLRVLGNRQYKLRETLIGYFKCFDSMFLVAGHGLFGKVQQNTKNRLCKLI